MLRFEWVSIWRAVVAFDGLLLSLSAAEQLVGRRREVQGCGSFGSAGGLAKHGWRRRLVDAGVAFRDAIGLNGGLGILLLKADTAGLVEGSKSGVDGVDGVIVWAAPVVVFGVADRHLEIGSPRKEVAP